MQVPDGVETWDFATLVSAAETALRLTAQAHAAWGFGRFARWDLDQDEGVLRFSDPVLHTAEAPAQIAGSFASGSGTWLWAWANPSLDRRLVDHSLVVKAYGARRGFERLVQPEWAATESECWSMTAITALLNGAQGAYRGPYSGGAAFITFGEVHLRR